jgi:hypothetical protein
MPSYVNRSSAKWGRRWSNGILKKDYSNVVLIGTLMTLLASLARAPGGTEGSPTEYESADRQRERESAHQLNG